MVDYTENHLLLPDSQIGLSLLTEPLVRYVTQRRVAEILVMATGRDLPGSRDYCLAGPGNPGISRPHPGIFPLGQMEILAW